MQPYSVLMTVYKDDNPDYFELSLKSMLGQTLVPDEIILVIDGPITKELQNVIDSLNNGIIKEISLPKNVGLGLALNEGIKNISNELIARMDSDDYSMPERCELQVKEFEKNPKLDIIGCPVREFVGSIGNIVGERKVPLTNEEIYNFSKKRDPFNHPTVMYRKSAVEAAGCYSDYRKNQDTDLWIKMLSNGVTCMNLADPVFLFRFDKSTYQKRKSWLNTKILIEIRYKAWKSGFNSFADFLMVTAAQLTIYLLPLTFQKLLYQKILRR